MGEFDQLVNGQDQIFGGQDFDPGHLYLVFVTASSKNQAPNTPRVFPFLSLISFDYTVSTLWQIMMLWYMT